MSDSPTTYQAIWNGAVLAESDETITVEGNQYFPPSSLNRDYFRRSGYRTVCPWKGNASYYSVQVDGKTNEDAAWYYPHPSPAAQKIAGYVAFWNGVRVVKNTNRSGDGSGNPARGLARLFGRHASTPSV